MLKIDVIKFEAQDVITTSIPALEPVKKCKCKAECFDWTQTEEGDWILGAFESHYVGNSGNCYCDADNHYYPNR